MAVVITESSHPSMKKIKFAWTSDASGDATGQTSDVYSGKCWQFTTVPASGDDAPSDNYDITITDSDGIDVLVGTGANRDTANTEHVTYGSLGAVGHSRLTITVANAGNENSGTAYLYVR